MQSKVKIGEKTLTLIEGDITEQKVDAIVNAANSQLILGAGVAGAIRSKGGPEIQAECDKIGFCEVGDAVITTGGDLKAKHVIHAVGPQMGEGDEDEKLKSATANSLRVASENQLKSICLPAISTGIFGFPKDRAAGVIYKAIIEYFVKEADFSIKQVRLTLFDQETVDVFKNVWQEVFPIS